MKAFTTLNGVAAILDKANVDTDQIIPKQFLRKIYQQKDEDFAKMELRIWIYAPMPPRMQASLLP